MTIVFKTNPRTGRKEQFDATEFSFPIGLPDSNQIVGALVKQAVESGAVVDTNNGITTYFIGKNYISSAVLQAMLSVSEVTITDLPQMYIKMTSSKYQQNVPVGIHERELDDGEGNMVNRKWSEWKLADTVHLDAIDGDKIVQGRSWGYELTAEEIATLLGLTGYTILTEAEVGAYVAQPEGV